MAASQFLLNSDDAGGPNKFLLNSDDPLLIAIAFSAQQAQQSAVALIDSAPAISFTNRQAQRTTVTLTDWSYTTLANPIFFGPGSIANLAQFVGSPPKAGDIIAYDGSNPTGLVIATDGSLSWLNYGTVQAQYNDGTTWFPFLITVSPWNVEAQQPQQSNFSVAAAAAIAFSAQQGQQSSISVTQLGTIAFTAQQEQRFSAVVKTSAAIAFSAQEEQQSGFSPQITVKPAFTAQQNQQSSVTVKAQPAIAFAAQQGQQGAFNVVAQTRADIAFAAQQGQQNTLAVSTRPAVAFLSAQPQQNAIDVIVPRPIAIAFTAQQGQQNSSAAAAAPMLSLVTNQPMQSSMTVNSSAAINFATQQGQQGSFSLPNLPPAIIEFSTQQGQQYAFEVNSSIAIEFFAQQEQTGTFTIKPLPGQLADIDPEGITFNFMTLPNDSQPYTKVIYLGRDNAASLGVLYYGVALDLGAVTRMLIDIPEIDVEIDSNGSPDYMTWAPGSNVIKFKLGGAPVPPGLYTISLIVFDIAHPRGQVFAGPAGELLLMDFAKDEAA